MEKKYTIQEILEIAADYLDNQNDEKSKERFEELKSSLVIREYIPMSVKYKILQIILFDCKMETTSGDSFSVGIELSKVFNGLFYYIVNLETPVQSIFKDYDYYDLIMISGLSDFILSVCEKDYNRLCYMVDNMIRFENLQDFMDIVDQASPEKMQEFIDSINGFIQKADPSTLKLYSDILSADDKLLKKIKNEIESVSFSGTPSGTKEEDVAKPQLL